MIYDGSGSSNGDDSGEPERLGRADTEALFIQALSEWDKRDAAIGDTISAEWFYDLLGVLHPSRANSFERSEAARKAFMMLFHGPVGFRCYVLERRKRYLKTNYAGGYEIIEPREQTPFAKRQRRRDINKALRDEMNLLSNVDMSNLSAAERRENADAIAHNVALAKNLHRKRPGFDEKPRKK